MLKVMFLNHLEACITEVVFNFVGILIGGFFINSKVHQ